MQIKDYYYKLALWKWQLTQTRRLVKFKDIHRGESCFIIGNGPSLNQMDLSPLKNYHTFGLNKIFLLFERVDLNLSYHVTVNPLVIQQSKAQIEALNCPSFLSYRFAKDIIKPLDHIYFISAGNKNDEFKFQTDIIGTIFEGYTVTYVAMQLAYYMGFKQVFLIGVDHNYVAVGKPNEQQLLTGSDPNHFDPNYFGNQQWHLPDLDGSEVSYQLAKYYYHQAGRNIYDATIDGKLKVFPKVDFESALAQCNQKLS